MQQLVPSSKTLLNVNICLYIATSAREHLDSPMYDISVSNVVWIK